VCDHPGMATEATPNTSDRVEIGPLDAATSVELFTLFAQIVADGDGFPQLPPLARGVYEDTWVRPITAVIGATVGGALAGAYYLKPNFAGRGAHIANAGYVVARAWRRQGIGRALVTDSIARAAALGFDAVQFNFVFEANPARGLYEELGWQVIGRIPGALGGEDALIYWRAVP